MNPMKALRQYQKVNSHAQVSEASPHRLIQMLLEGGLDRLAQAKGAMSRGDTAQKCVLITKAIDIITGLRQGLDEEKAEDPAAIQQLDSLYEYMNTRLVQANARNDADAIDEVARLLITVKTGWDAIAPQ
ncbi:MULTISPECIES: flagellar export chaperone FliS [Pseudomonas]|uniref:Flagellar secretion chaperone FliS n=1 Tax=Pseudomonas lactis TaxID=1615674 RepID=I4KAT2_9PSED|nr:MULTISPECIES: flagellar export chaperone FliS [Pseudomonas]EIK61822.1 flagellar protein FliS [Pseudomonas lactis]MBV2080203.1 flagellar export chaperone FliS [Pseudomonas carnis]MBV2085789.1 flagellar export chaperone FliS [Pseudomonas carnis]MDI3248648.1 flagellar export chaperone FliS [Pseudomonas sp. AL10]MDI3264536.1 flagellar export chaperone FliS [Pseudomonas sp. AL15]